MKSENSYVINMLPKASCNICNQPLINKVVNNTLTNTLLIEKSDKYTFKERIIIFLGILYKVCFRFIDFRKIDYKKLVFPYSCGKHFSHGYCYYKKRTLTEECLICSKSSTVDLTEDN